MSYIPDYRQETDKLIATDQAYVEGYRAAMEDAMNIFENLDMYEVSEEDTKVLMDFRKHMEDWLGMEETATVLSLFESGPYDGLELKDANLPLHTGKGAERHDKS